MCLRFISLQKNPVKQGRVLVVGTSAKQGRQAGSMSSLPNNSEAGLLNKRLMLSSSFRCDQIYKYMLYDFGHTLLCYLSRT